MPSIYFKVMPREWLFDEKLNSLGLEYKGAWANLLSLVKICGDNGKFIDVMGQPYSSDYIIKNARISAIHFNKFMVANMIQRSSNGHGVEYSVKNWLKYQPEYDRTKIYRNSMNQLEKERESTKEKENTSKTETDRHRLKAATPKPSKNLPESLPMANFNSGVANIHPNKTSKFQKAKVIQLKNEKPAFEIDF